MSFSSKFIKKKNKRWHYYPYGTVLEDVSMPIKKGRKTSLEGSLNSEMILASEMTVFVVALAFFYNKWMLFVGVLGIPVLILKRKNSVKENCEFIDYPLSIWMKNYHKINIHYADPSAFRTLLIGYIAFLCITISFYIDEGMSNRVLLFSFLLAIGFYSVYVAGTAWEKNRNLPNYKKPEPIFTKKNICSALIKYLLVPVLIVSAILGYFHYFNIE